MIPITTFSGKKVALFGLGGSGLATAKALSAGGCEVVAWDDNPAGVEKAQLEGIQTEDFKAGDSLSCNFSEFAALVLAPGVPLTNPKPHWSVELARNSNVPIIGDIELFACERRAVVPDAPFIAITGTNGKSTTTALIAHMLSHAGRDVQLGGNIGRAVLSLDPLQNDRFYVVEVSSYQIDLAPTLDAGVGLLLNLSPDHLDRHGTMDRYAGIKKLLVEKAKTAIIGVDDARCANIAAELVVDGHEVISISKNKPLASGIYADDANLVLAETGKTVANIEGVGSLRGTHNAQNAAAAVAACRAVGLSFEEIQAGLRSFPGLVHRMEQVGHLGKVLFVNDSKATNAEAAAPALASFEHIYWIAGGLAKDGGIELLEPWYSRIAKAYLIGEAAPVFSATLSDQVDYEISAELEAAIAHAAHDASLSPHDDPVVLLSPACASFDQFPNFEQRGFAFKNAAKALDGFQPIEGTS
jgi:UDP-N-acetylmuramoylalanine--D-glutamate ligase